MNFSCRILFAWTLAFAYLILVLLGPVDTSLIEFKIHMGALPAFWRNLFPWLQTAILLISLIIMRFPLSLRLLSLHLQNSFSPLRRSSGSSKCLALFQ